MRILMIIDGLPGGGAEKTVLTLARGLLEMGHRVSVFSLRKVCDYTIPDGVDFHIVQDTCHTPWRKLTELRRRAQLLDKAYQAAEQEGGEFDLICSHLHKTDRIVSYTKVIPRHKLWFCIHGMFSFSYLVHKRGFSRWLKMAKIRRVYQGAQIVAVSQAVLDDLTENLAIKPSRKCVIYNPFDIAHIQTLAQQPCELSGKEYLIHVGRFHELKRHDRLIRAYAKSGIQAPLVLMGKGSPDKIEYLKALAANAGVGDRVLFKSFENNPYPWIKHAKELVLSSDCEGFGNVLVEAIICHTPPVSTDCPGGPSEILTGELSRGLAQMNDAALARTMRDIWETPPRINTDTIENYSIRTICQHYLTLAQR